MAKKKPAMVMQEIEEAEKELNEGDASAFTTAGGIVIPLRPIPPMLMQKVYNAVPIPAPPTYEVEIAGGGTQLFQHDEESVQGDPEAERAWREYKEAVAEAEAERNTRALRVM